MAPTVEGHLATAMRGGDALVRESVADFGETSTARVLEHLRGVPWARIGELVGQRNLAVTANTYTHVLTDEAELDYSGLLAGTSG